MGAAAGPGTPGSRDAPGNCTPHCRRPSRPRRTARQQTTTEMSETSYGTAQAGAQTLAASGLRDFRVPFETATKFGEYRRKKRRQPPVTVASLRLFLRSSTGPNRAFEPQSLGRDRDPVRIAQGPTAIDAATQRRHFGFRLRLVDKWQPIGGGSGRPPCGFWDGSASAHCTHARITASSWDTFDQATAGPSVPLLSLTMDHISPYWYIRGVTPRRRIRRW